MNTIQKICHRLPCKHSPFPAIASSICHYPSFESSISQMNQCHIDSLFNISHRYRPVRLMPSYIENPKQNKHGFDNKFIIHSKRRNVKGGVKKYNNYVWHLRGMSVDEALIQMRFARSRRGYEFFSMLRNGQSNAVNQFGMNPDNLVIQNILVGRAMQPKVIRLRGRARPSLVKLRHTHLHARIIENSQKAAKSKRGYNNNDKRIVAKDRPQPNIIFD